MTESALGNLVLLLQLWSEENFMRKFLIDSKSKSLKEKTVDLDNIKIRNFYIATNLINKAK
jgi:hypothetical protein